MRHKRPIIGAGILTAVVITFSFLAKPHDDVPVTSQPSPVASSTSTTNPIPTVSPTPTLTAGDFDAYYNRGISYYSQGNYQQAIEDFTKALSINSNSAIAYAYRADSYDNLRDDLRNPKQAIADYQKAAELYKKQGNTKDYQDALVRIKELQQ